MISNEAATFEEAKLNSNQQTPSLLILVPLGRCWYGMLEQRMTVSSHTPPSWLFIITIPQSL
jgi:hypothetical protein